MIRSIILKFVIILNLIIIQSCHMEDSGYTLSGKIAVRKLMDDKYFIYIDSDIPKKSFKVKNEKSIRYSGFIWLNKEDNFLGLESISELNPSEYRCNIAKFDITGKLIDKIYESGKGEIAWVKYSSKNDKYLLFTTHRLIDPKLYPFEGLAPMLSLQVMDLDKKKIIKSIDSIGRATHIEFQESPWLIDGLNFVYSISEGVKFVSEGKAVNTLKEPLKGIYIYNLNTNEQKLIIPNGRFAIASPIDNVIAYMKDTTVQVFNLNSKFVDTIYKIGKEEEVTNMHWTPDGKYIYLVSSKYYGTRNNFTSEEKLIEISSGKEIAFKKIGQGLGNYTWK